VTVAAVASDKIVMPHFEIRKPPVAHVVAEWLQLEREHSVRIEHPCAVDAPLRLRRTSRRVRTRARTERR
jgi:hypothetical protein